MVVESCCPVASKHGCGIMLPSGIKETSCLLNLHLAHLMLTNHVGLQLIRICIQLNGLLQQHRLHVLGQLLLTMQT